MKNFINFLPPWVETNIQPAFYDKESGTCLQQTARMYAKVNQLIRCFNYLSKDVQDYVEQVIDLRNYVDDYFDNFDVQDEIDNKLDEMVANGTFADLFNDIVFKVDVSRKSKINHHLIAHRGSQLDAPENTMPAFEIASQLGFWGIECDVNKTSDNVFIIFHDTTLDRMTNGTGNVIEKTYAEIRALDITDGANVSLYPNLKIPTLENYLELCYKSNVVPVIELKGGTIVSSDCAGILALIRKYNLEDRAIVISFDTSLLETMRGLSPKLSIQAVYNSLTTAKIDYCFSRKFGVDAEKSAWNTTLVNYARTKGVETNVWTVGSLADFTAQLTHSHNYYTTNAIGYCVDYEYPIYISEEGIKAWSEYDKEQIISHKPLRRVARTDVLRDYANTNYRQDRALFPYFVRVDGCPVITYDFSDPKYDNYNLTIRGFKKDGTQIADTGWIDHTKFEFDKLTKDVVWINFYGGRTDNTYLTQHDLEMLEEMVEGLKINTAYRTTGTDDPDNPTYEYSLTRYSNGEQEYAYYLYPFTPNYEPWGSLYTYNKLLDITYPVPFVSSPTVMSSFAASTIGNGISGFPKYNITKLTRISMIRGDADNGNVAIRITLKGMRK